LRSDALIFSEDLEEDEREAGADCTDSGAREVVEQVDEEDSLLVLLEGSW